MDPTDSSVSFSTKKCLDLKSSRILRFWLFDGLKMSRNVDCAEYIEAHTETHTGVRGEMNGRWIGMKGDTDIIDFDTRQCDLVLSDVIRTFESLKDRDETSRHQTE